jgi:hypothetical protein
MMIFLRVIISLLLHSLADQPTEVLSHCGDRGVC